MWILKQYCGGDCWSLLRFVINIHQLCEYKDRVGEGECQNSLLTLYCNDTLWHHNVTIMCIDEWTWWLRWNRIRCTHRWINLRQRQCALISVSVQTHSCTWPQVLSHLWLMRLPANHVEDLEGGRDGPVLVTVHLWNTNTWWSEAAPFSCS